MDRLNFLKRLGLLAAVPIIAIASSITKDETETIIDGDVRINGRLTIHASNNTPSAFTVNPYQDKLIVSVPKNTPVDTSLELILGS